MAKLKEEVANRTKKILYADKLINPNMFRQTLKLELYKILSQFMELKSDDINLTIMVDPTGKYKINLLAYSEKIKPAGQIIE